MAEWQPIETAPTDGTYVDLWVQDETGGERYPDMAYVPGDHTSANDWESRDGLFCLVGDGLYSLNHVTHWMPLPDPPEATQ